MNFTASAEAFRAATEEYRDIWVKEGSRIVETMERVTGLRFEPGPIEVSIYEGTSYAGERGGRPMFLRATYPTETKRGTLVHELAHRLAADVPFKGTIWQRTLAQTAAERARRLREILGGRGDIVGTSYLSSPHFPWR